MPRFLIEEPSPFASLSEWEAFYIEMAMLPPDEPEVCEARARALAEIAKLRFPELQTNEPSTPQLRQAG